MLTGKNCLECGFEDNPAGWRVCKQCNNKRFVSSNTKSIKEWIESLVSSSKSLEIAVVKELIDKYAKKIADNKTILYKDNFNDKNDPTKLIYTPEPPILVFSANNFSSIDPWFILTYSRVLWNNNNSFLFHYLKEGTFKQVNFNSDKRELKLTNGHILKLPGLNGNKIKELSEMFMLIHRLYCKVL